MHTYNVCSLVDHTFAGLRRIEPSERMLAEHKATSYLTAVTEVQAVVQREGHRDDCTDENADKKKPLDPSDRNPDAASFLPAWESLAEATVCPLTQSTAIELEEQNATFVHCRVCGKLYGRMVCQRLASLPRLGILRPVTVCDVCFYQRLNVNIIRLPGHTGSITRTLT